MSKRDRRDGDRRGDRRDSQPEDEQQRRTGESEIQEGDSVTALKAILSKVASLLKPLQLSPDESIRLVEQLYGKVLETDLQLAGETDDTRKSSVLAAIQNAVIRREGDRIVVDHSPAKVAPVETGGPGPAATPAPPVPTQTPGAPPAPAPAPAPSAPPVPAATPSAAQAPPVAETPVAVADVPVAQAPAVEAPAAEAPAAEAPARRPTSTGSRRAAPKKAATASPAPAEGDRPEA